MLVINLAIFKDINNKLIIKTKKIQSYISMIFSIFFLNISPFMMSHLFKLMRSSY